MKKSLVINWLYIFSSSSSYAYSYTRLSAFLDYAGGLLEAAQVTSAQVLSRPFGAACIHARKVLHLIAADSDVQRAAKGKS